MIRGRNFEPYIDPNNISTSGEWVKEGNSNHVSDQARWLRERYPEQERQNSNDRQSGNQKPNSGVKRSTIYRNGSIVYTRRKWYLRLVMNKLTFFNFKSYNWKSNRLFAIPKIGEWKNRESPYPAINSIYSMFLIKRAKPLSRSLKPEQLTSLKVRRT